MGHVVAAFVRYGSRNLGDHMRHLSSAGPRMPSGGHEPTTSYVVGAYLEDPEQHLEKNQPNRNKKTLTMAPMPGSASGSIIVDYRGCPSSPK